MPSDKHNSITAKAMGLIFSLFVIASAQEVPFGIPQYIQCILHGLTSDCSIRVINFSIRMADCSIRVS